MALSMATGFGYHRPPKVADHERMAMDRARRIELHREVIETRNALKEWQRLEAALRR